MAAFKQHVTFSSLLGIGYAAALAHLGMEWIHGILGGMLCGMAGMLPDLDSPSGRPVRELFGVTAVAVPLLLLQRWQNAGVTPEGTILLAGLFYLAIRFGAAWVLKHVTVHRGMFHSLPAAAIAAEVVFLAHTCPEPYGRLALAGGVLLGFLSHLVLDEIYSVDARGLTIRLSKSAGSAIKLFSSNFPATVTAWLILASLTYLVGVDQGFVQPIHFSLEYPSLSKVAPGLRDIPAHIPGSPLEGQQQP